MRRQEEDTQNKQNLFCSTGTIYAIVILRTLFYLRLCKNELVA